MNEDPGGRATRAVEPRAHVSTILPLTSVKAPARKARSVAYASVEAMVAKLRPVDPLQALRPHTIKKLASWFVSHFPGDVLYAVKTNPDPRVLAYVHQAGVSHFDVASLAEIRTVAGLLPDARMYYMHPVKPREAIYEAYFRHGIRDFSLDSHDELQKILEVTHHADDLRLYVRLSIPNDKAAYTLAGKFGVKLEESASLIQATRKAAHKFGICFHVGSQCMDPEAYATTLGYVRDLLTQSDVRLDMIDVGGGFPSAYPGMTPPAMGAYMDVIKASLATLPIDADCQVLCEPGRALVAEGGSIVVRVELKKKNMLHINDGSFGALFDAAYTKFNFPVKAIRPNGVFEGKLKAFGFFGPTCDSMDAMKGPFMLPADIREGDWIEIGQLGAYGHTMRTKFNGFHSDTTVEVKDEPIMSVKL